MMVQRALYVASQGALARVCAAHQENAAEMAKELRAEEKRTLKVAGSFVVPGHGEC